VTAAKNTLSAVQISQLTHALQGTCDSLGNTLDRLFELDEDALTTADFLAIDQEVFCCQTCNWWCEQCEMAERADDEWICQQCTDEE
jgi:hypothetical protein